MKILKYWVRSFYPKPLSLWRIEFYQMYKKPNPQWFKLFKRAAAIAFVAESVAFVGSYYFYRRLNTNRDFRYYCYNNYPFVLEGFYKLGEFFDDKQNANRIRTSDLAVWNATNPEHS